MKKLFVIMPFGIKLNSEGKRINFDLIYNELIKPVGKLENWQVYRIDEISQTGLITNQYLEELLEADMVLAEISTQNANVFFELGIRQTISNKGTILIAESGTILPFDISNQRVIFYENSTKGFQTGKQEILRALEKYDSSKNPVNDFFSSYRKGILNTKSNSEIELEFKHQLSIADSLGEYMLVWEWVKDSDNIHEKQLLDLSKEFINRQRWSLAEDVLVKAFQQNPKDVIVSKELGWVLSKQGLEYHSKALDYLLNALELDPKNSEVLGIIGGIYKSESNLDEAIKYYSLGAKYSPNDNYMLITQAALEIIASPDSPTQGISDYQLLENKILSDSNYESNIWSLVNLAEAYFVTGKTEESIKIFKKVFTSFDDIKPIISASKQISEIGKSGFKTGESNLILKYLKESLSDYEKQLEEISEEKFLMQNQVENLPLIIHISDLHFGVKVNGQPMHRFIPTTDDRRDLSTHVIDEIKLKYPRKYQNAILIASGDFVYMGNEAEFNLALNCLNEICHELEIEKRRVVLVPGNHDINWIKDKGGEGKRFEDYLVFIHKFYGEVILKELYPFLSDSDFNILSPPTKPENIISFHFISDTITIVGMNSCIYENSQNHYGFVGWQQFKNIKTILGAASEKQKTIQMAVVHHQMHPFPEALPTIKKDEKWIDLSIIRDGGFVERNLQDLDFDLVFHGHKHHPQIRETKVSVKQERFDKRRSLLVLGAGSVSVESSERGNIPNQFQTIEFLSLPRIKSIDFVNIVWHELDDVIGADWQSINRWTVSG